MVATRFDDIDALNALASETFGSWGDPLTVTRAMVDRFAAIVGESAGPSVPPMLLLSLLPQLGAVPARVGGHRSATNYGAERVRFFEPVLAGEQIRARTRVVRAEAKPKGTLVTGEVEVAAVDGDEPALHYRMQILYR